MAKKQKGHDEVYCRSCGTIIKKEAEICPKCGVRQKDYTTRQGRSKTIGIILAVFLSPFNWLYTYRYDKVKFWIALPVDLLLIWTVIVPIGIWIWSIVDMAIKDDKLYEKYNEK